MPLVKVKEKYQVTIPATMRERLGLKVGDLLEVELHDHELIFKPQLVVDKTQAWKRFESALKEVHEKNKDFSDEEVMADVLQAIQEVRKRKHAHRRC